MKSAIGGPVDLFCLFNRAKAATVSACKIYANGGRVVWKTGTCPSGVQRGSCTIKAKCTYYYGLIASAYAKKNLVVAETFDRNGVMSFRVEFGNPSVRFRAQPTARPVVRARTSDWVGRRRGSTRKTNFPSQCRQFTYNTGQRTLNESKRVSRGKTVGRCDKNAPTSDGVCRRVARETIDGGPATKV